MNIDKFGREALSKTNSCIFDTPSRGKREKGRLTQSTIVAMWSFYKVSTTTDLAGC